MRNCIWWEREKPSLLYKTKWSSAAAAQTFPLCMFLTMKAEADNTIKTVNILSLHLHGSGSPPVLRRLVGRGPRTMLVTLLSSTTVFSIQDIRSITCRARWVCLPTLHYCDTVSLTWRQHTDQFPCLAGPGGSHREEASPGGQHRRLGNVDFSSHLHPV